MSRQHHPGILQHLPWLVLASLFVASSAKAQSDADGSLDLDLVFAIDAPTTALAGRPFDVGFDFASLLSSEGDAFELGLSMVLPADVSFVESELLGRPTRRRVDADTGETTLTFSTSRGLIPGDSLEGSMTLLAILPPGEEVPLRWLGHAGDSPFGLGAPPPGENAATFGALDLTHPTAALAGSTVSSDDDAPAGFPTTLPASDSALFTTATVRLTPFEVEVIPHVAEGERATGTGVNAYLTTIRLTGNGIDEVTGVSVEDVLSNNREFLGWDDVPAGVMVDAWANEPTAGEVMLTLSDVLIPTNGMVDVVYRSGITEYRVGDATNEHLGGAASSVAVQDGALVRDGGATPGGGEPATDDAVALTGYFQGISLPPELIPPPARAAVEAEYVAVQKGRDRKIKVIDDTVVYTLSYQVSEYLALQGPMTFTDTLPDGLVFDGAGSVTIEQSGGSTISFDVSSGTADPFHGDTEIRFTLAGGGTLPAAATGTIRYTATVDGLFEGPGNIDYECSETLTNLVRVDAVVSDEGTTDPSILGTGTADDSAATITTPEPTLEKVFVSMMDPDGVLHDGTAGTPDFDVVNEPVLPGSTLLFAVTAEFPRVPTLGVRLDDYLPLLTTSAAEIVDIRLNVDSSLVDVDGVSIATNDGDGDGFADDTMAGRRAPFDASSGGFPDTVLNNALRFELGDVPPEARFVLLIETQVTDEVPDPLPADGLVPTRNAAVLSWVDDEDVVQGTLVVNREFDIALGSVQASKSVSPSRPDAGDTARYTVRLENVGPAPAYLDDVIDTLPDGLTFVPGSVTIEDGDGVDVAASPSHELDGNELRFWFRPTGATHPSLLPAAGDVDSNVVVITYETVVASDMNPKTALVNTVRTDYFSRPDSPDSFKLGTAMDSVTLTTEEVKLAKNVISSSEPSTSGTELAIGETAVMEIEVRIPEGRMEAAVLTEVMPRGLELLSAELVSVDPRLSIGGPAELVLTDDRYSDGALDTLTVDLGEVVHPATDDDLFASIFFRVVVRTLDVSQSTNWRSWRAMTYLHDGDELEDRYGRSVRVVLPELVLTKTGDVGAVDSGDAVTYTLRLEHGPGTRADAFDIVLEEPLSSSLSLVSAGTPRTSMMLGSAPVVQGSGEPGDPVVLTIDELPIGEWVEVDVQCMVLGEIRSSTTIRNQATASFDSLPGDDAHARTFSVEDSLDIASRALGLTHALIDADHPATSGSEAVVGEVVTFRVTVDVLEGVTEDMVVDVTLPDGLVFLDEVGVRLDPSLSVARIPGVETVSGDLSWSFGDVTNHDRDNDRGEEIAIEYRAVVANVAENQVGANVVSAASVTSAAGDRGPVDAVGSVVEPLLELDAGFLVRHAQVGDVVPLSLKARHALSSGSTAHDAFIELTLPDWLTWIDPDPSGPAGMIEYDSATRLVRIELGDMTTDMGPASPMGLDLDLQLGRNPDGAVLTPTLRWSTLSGDPVMRVPGAPISTERTGSASDPGGSINDLYFSGEAALLGAHFLIGFEDLAGHPSANDFDYNDLLCRIELDESYDEDGLTRFEVTIEAMARGASFNHRLLLRLGIAGETDTTVVHRDASGGHLGTESFSNDGDVIEDLTIFESTWGAMPPNGDGPDWWSANTDVAQDETIAGWVTTVEVIVHEPERNPRIPDLAATPGIDEHVLGLLGFSLWVHGEDYEVVADGVGRNATLALLSADRFPGHALNGHPLRQFELFHGDGDWPTERTSVWTTFPDYVQHLRAGRHDRLGWAESPDPSRSWRSRRSSGLRSVSANTSSEPSIDPLSATPLLLDVDGDGVMEVIQGSFGGVITVVDPMTGAVESQFDLGQGRTSQASITGVDLDGDDIPEVVRGHEDGTVWASALDGTGRRQLAATGGPIKSTVSVGDLHEDGGVDLVFMSGDGDLWILDGAGVRAPVTTTVSSVADVGHHYFLTSTPAIADLDGEPGLEIVVGTLDGHVVALDADGVMLPGWPHDMGAPVLSSVALGDVDGDGATDVVAHDNDGRLVVLDASGTPLPGWPVQVRNGGGPSSPTLVDQDRDGEWEIVVGSLGGATWSFTPDGLVRPGWPHQAGGPVIGSPIAVDVDDDLELE
ncbi:MAG: FG-GAP-like repeat-containing protein, partial [Acidobacteriota bacterium]